MKLSKCFTKRAWPQTVCSFAILLMYGFEMRTYLGGYLPINIITIIIIILFLYSFSVILRISPKSIYRTPTSLDTLVYVFLLLYGLRLAWNIYIDGYKQLIFNNDITCFVYLIFLCFIPYIAFRKMPWAIIDMKSILRVLIYIMLFGLIISIKSFYSVIAAGFQHFQGRAFANELLDSIGYGHLALTFIFACYCYLKLEVNKKKWIYYIFISFGLLSMGLANARSPFIVLFFCLFISLIRRLSIKTIVFSFIVVALIGSNLEYISDFFVEKFNSPFIERLMNSYELGMVDASSGRDVLFSLGWKMFTNNPIIGESLVITEGEYAGSYVHNSIIEVLMGMGLIGGLFYFIINAIAFISAYRLIEVNSKYSFFAFVFFQYFIILQFSRSLLLLPLYFVSIASVYSCYVFEKRYSKKEL